MAADKVFSGETVGRHKLFCLVLVLRQQKCFLCTGLCPTTPGERFLEQASWHDIQIGMAELVVDMYLVLIIWGNWDYSPEGYFIGCAIINSCIQNMLMPSVQCHNTSAKAAIKYLPTKTRWQPIRCFQGKRSAGTNYFALYLSWGNKNASYVQAYVLPLQVSVF